MQAYFEEMCVQVILPVLNEQIKIAVTIEHSEDEEETSVIIQYNGNPFNPMTSTNELSLLLAKNSAKEITYTHTVEKDYPNTVVAKI